jgi:hypothetical protein
MRQEFVSEGVSEDILEKLKKTWEQKIKSKNIDGLSQRMPEITHHNFVRGAPYGIYP